MIHATIIDKHYSGGQTVIEGLELILERGEFVALIAPSGAGKSSLLRILAGIDTEYEGGLGYRPNGRELDGAQGGAVSVGLMFQEPRLLPWMTVLENLCLVDEGRYSGETARRLLAEVGLAGWEQAFPAELSGGMQRRVALARTLMPEPQLLLLDEPLVSLDEPSAEALRDVLSDVCRQRGCSVLYVTHRLEEAVSLADRIVFLSTRPARLLYQQTLPQAALRNAAYQAEILALLRSRPGLLDGLFSAS